MPTLFKISSSKCLLAIWDLLFPLLGFHVVWIVFNYSPDENRTLFEDLSKGLSSFKVFRSPPVPFLHCLFLKHGCQLCLWPAGSQWGEGQIFTAVLYTTRARLQLYCLLAACLFEALCHRVLAPFPLKQS